MKEKTFLWNQSLVLLLLYQLPMACSAITPQRYRLAPNVWVAIPQRTRVETPRSLSVILHSKLCNGIFELHQVTHSGVKVTSSIPYFAIILTLHYLGLFIENIRILSVTLCLVSVLKHSLFVR
jgi:hypothetical protein